MANVKLVILGQVPKRRTAVTRFPCLRKVILCPHFTENTLIEFLGLAILQQSQKSSQNTLAWGSMLACSAHWCRVASCKDTKKKIAGDVAVIVAVSVKTPSS